MRVNTGGILAPQDVVGRDAFIESLWRTLERQGIVLVAERRMGKTSILIKMKAEPPPDTLVLMSDVEGASRVAEFIELLLREIGRHLGTATKVATWFDKLKQDLGGTEVGGWVKLPAAAAQSWKAHLARLLGDLATNHPQRLVLVWDELPWMLQKVAAAEGPAMVVDLLDVLRSQRQKHRNLRMVYTGSIGLHHVARGLHEGGPVGAPLNDLRTIEVPPLDREHAAGLALSLLHGEGLQMDEPEAVAAAIAGAVEGIPYFVQHIVAGLADRRQRVTRERVEQQVAEALTDPQDPWNLEHYRQRMGEYYGAQAGLARAVLNQLAEFDSLTLGELHERLRVSFQGNTEADRKSLEGDREPLRSLLKRLQRDHYLRQEASGAYAFRFAILRRWWRLDLDMDRDME